MGISRNIQIIFCIVALGCPSILTLPLDNPASAAVPLSEASPAAVIESPVAPIAPIAPVQVAPAAVAPGSVAPGGGTITEHKNPDGSILTITRFNGQVPPSAFPSNPFEIVHQNMFASQMQNMALMYDNLNRLQRLNNNFNFYNTNPYLNFNYNAFANSHWFPAYPFQYSYPGGIGGGWGSPFGSPFYYPWGPAGNQGYQRSQ